MYIVFVDFNKSSSQKTCIETSAYIQVLPSTVTVVGYGDDPIRTSDEWPLRYNSSICRSCFLCVLGIVIIIFCIHVYFIIFILIFFIPPPAFIYNNYRLYFIVLS